MIEISPFIIGILLILLARICCARAAFCCGRQKTPTVAPNAPPTTLSKDWAVV